MSHVVSNGEWALTGKTRWQMRGLFWWRKPALQVQETTDVTETETNTFDQRSYRTTRWRWVNNADRLNLGMEKLK